eukprot:gene6537-6763_t
MDPIYIPLLVVHVVGTVVLLGAGTFCVAAGLYFAADWLEDHTKSSHKLIKNYTIFCSVMQLFWLVMDPTALIPNLDAEAPPGLMAKVS